MHAQIDPASTERQPVQSLTAGLIRSSVLHVALLLLLVFVLPWLTRARPDDTPQILPVDLTRLSEKTAALPSLNLAALPQDKAEEISEADRRDAVPVEQTPPPQAAPHQADERSPPVSQTAMQPDQERAFSRPAKAPKPNVPPSAKLRDQPLPADDLGARLERLAKLRQPEAPIPSRPRQQAGSGSSNLTVSSAEAAPARDATLSVKDFIRAQVERRWTLDGNTVKGEDWSVGIHIMLRPDGSVRQAEIVDNSRYRSDRAYREFALSARNAVLLSSPLTMPTGEYDIAKDIVLDFRAKQVLQ